MNRAEKIKYVESLLSGEINPIQEKKKYFWFRPDGIFYGEEDTPPADGMKITKEQLLKINGKKDIIFLSDEPKPDFELKGSVTRFIDIDDIIKSLTPSEYGGRPDGYFESKFII